MIVARSEDSGRIKVVATNRKARRNYSIIDTFEAGMALVGSEVKSLRDGRIDLKDSFAHIDGGEVFLSGCYIGPYEFARDGGHDPERHRKLLMHRREIDRVSGQLAEKGLTLVPLQVYFKDGKAKVELGLAKGRSTVDKRQSLKDREHKKEIERSLGRRRG
ncbi:MAG: SsrA-binding protein SmpB [Acidimicrobiia bacterium]